MKGRKNEKKKQFLDKRGGGVTDCDKVACMTSQDDDGREVGSNPIGLGVATLYTLMRENSHNYYHHNTCEIT